MNSPECKHRIKFVETSKVNGVMIEKRQCTKCGKWEFIDHEKRKWVSFNGGLGEEIWEEGE